MFKHTKIGATIGPACQDAATLEEMVKAGLNFARLNFAHGTYDTHTELIKTIRAVETKTGKPIPILQDLQGPRIRIGTMPDAGVEIKTGATVTLDTGKQTYDGAELPVDHPELHKDLKPGERILIDDGRIELKITTVNGTQIETEVIEGGVVKSHKGINAPDSSLHIPALSDKDREDLRFGVKMGVDMVGMSFVSTASDILDIKFLIKQIAEEEQIKLDQPIFIIAKIERHEAVENLKEILEVVDGIMVARGDLGLEMPKEELPMMQKKIIDAANLHARPVIVATQLLDSMQTNRRPTRA